MKTVTFRDGSWHHKLASYGGVRDDETDICTYLGCVAKTLIGIVAGVCLVGMLGVSIAFFVGDFLAWIVAEIFFSFVEPGLGAVIFIAACAFGGVFLMVVALSKVGESIKRAGADSFIGAARESLKDRICFRVRIR